MGGGAVVSPIIRRFRRIETAAIIGDILRHVPLFIAHTVEQGGLLSMVG